MKKAALIIVDVQKDFLPGGSLFVPKGNEIIPVIHRIVPAFGKVLLTMDSHPKNHKSFASNNPGKRPFEMGELNGHPQMMWPDHCVPGTDGWWLEESIRKYVHQNSPGGIATNVFMKGENPDHDSYSGFRDDGNQGTGLLSHLQDHSIKSVYICGLATDYCVKATALDAVAARLETTVIVDACRGLPSGVEDAYAEMLQKKVKLCHSDNLCPEEG